MPLRPLVAMSRVTVVDAVETVWRAVKPCQTVEGHESLLGGVEVLVGLVALRCAALGGGERESRVPKASLMLKVVMVVVLSRLFGEVLRPIATVVPSCVNRVFAGKNAEKRIRRSPASNAPARVWAERRQNVR